MCTASNKDEWIKELEIMQNHADDVEQWDELEQQIKELEMQYEDEDGNLQWL